jgi:hypothetical protein
MSWTWRLEAADGTPVAGSIAMAVPVHPTQSDAESWLGEAWRELAGDGVVQASLLNDGRVVYPAIALTE